MTAQRETVGLCFQPTISASFLVIFSSVSVRNIDKEGGCHTPIPKCESKHGYALIIVSLFLPAHQRCHCIVPLVSVPVFQLTVVL